MKQTFKQNEHCLLNTIVRPDKMGWVSENTAVLIVHGIGDQMPLETLDQFGRGLLKQYKKKFGDHLKLTHKLVKPHEKNGTIWYNNMLRIQRDDDEHFIDLYEYYWADMAQDKASWQDINAWLQDVVKGAEAQYKENAVLGKQYKDHSPFFDSVTGNFKPRAYRHFLVFTSKIFFLLDAVCKGFLWLVGLIPYFGKIADSWLESYFGTKVHQVVNIVSEVAIYNTQDPKSKFFAVRDQIAAGAVSAVQYLVEKTRTAGSSDPLKDDINDAGTVGKVSADNMEKEKDLTQELYYPSIVVAGHSLGSQVSYDAISRINLFVNQGIIKTYDKAGQCIVKNNVMLADQLKGFITFGCPLDKIFFFLRENVPNVDFIWQQFVDQYYCFKRRPADTEFNNTDTNKQYVEIGSNIDKLLETVQWRNYFDDKDYVSGALDYYYPLTNINCQFKAGKYGFTHSYYWDCDYFFIDIIDNFLSA